MRKRALTIAALAAALLLAWVAAPALSLRPYVPEVENFEERLPEAKRLTQPDHGQRHGHDQGGEGSRFISPPVEAPHEFDLVGVADEMRHLEIRVRDSGGRWSEWVEQTDGTPIYVGGADQAQVRAAFEPTGELHFVNVSGTAGGVAKRVLDSARGAINQAFIALASSSFAEAAVPKPGFKVRATWGADTAEGGCVPKGPPELGEVRSGVIHHTVNANTYSAAEAPGIVLGICSFHINANGWNDIGYNALVDRFGTLYEGRAGGLRNPVVGAHAQGFNAQTTSIASLGEHSSTTLSRPAQKAVVRHLAWRLRKAGLNPVTKKSKLRSAGGSLSKYPAGTVVGLPRVLGHRDLGNTSCPGNALASQIAAIRRQTQKRIKRFSSKCFKPCRRCKRKGGRACVKCKRCKRKAKQRKRRAKLRARQSAAR